tara:strand:+ start:3220 stop:3492 length:273 start_codon:yes stop_codon:yes gene_type:complete
MSATAVLKWIGGFILFGGWWLVFDSFIPQMLGAVRCQMGNGVGLSACTRGVGYITSAWSIILVLVAISLTFALVFEAIHEAGYYSPQRKR